MPLASSHFLVVGLGNIPYPGTRHSIGHLVLDGLASRLGVSLTSDQEVKGFRATKHNVPIGSADVSITLYKPKALMNISGPPVARALKSLAIQPSNMIVVHDSLDHKPMKLSPKFGGSASGHNGVRSIIEALGGEKDFHRLRIGIGRDQSDPADYVLGLLPRSERVFWQDGEGTDAVWSALLKIMVTPR
ncbi:peptidyl-tRNA hydrolase [Fomitopsis serialis]|uniref:peptidyl-tRNA hydrolase n=1 Tax=Fomitopsis serialis TaxID=139415 RepID=UPI0020076E7B|nr:peptidyl-tRNA hydrolase [Neoantrodia serialis]KAH9935720.1 peptidyl-tRNA hydrolase [Neoantrodia serialis]